MILAHVIIIRSILNGCTKGVQLLFIQGLWCRWYYSGFLHQALLQQPEYPLLDEYLESLAQAEGLLVVIAL